MDELIIIGDRVLIAPDDGEKQTKSGLYLPATVLDRERVRSGRVVKVGPGYLTPNPDYAEGEPWAAPRDLTRYLPLQARPGDYAFFLSKEAIEMTWQERAYMIVPHQALLALLRPPLEDLVGPLDDLHAA